MEASEKLYSEPTRCCRTCKWLYIKDFVTGLCDNPETSIAVVQPYDTCEKWEVRVREGL